MKRGYIFTFLSLLSLSFASAYGGGYSSFGFSGLFSEFNISMYLNALLFVTLFAVIFFILKKSPFRDNSAVCWIISLCVASFGMWGIILSGFSFEDLIYSLGISSELIPTVLAMIGVAIAIFIILKYGFRNFLATVFALLGALLVALSLFGVVYEQGAGILIGLGFLLLALILKKKIGIPGLRLPGIKFRGGARMMIYADGRRYTSPIFRAIPLSIQSNSGSRIAIENAGDKPLEWVIKTWDGLRASPTRGIVQPGQANEIKIYFGSGGGTKRAMVLGKSQGGFSKQKAKILVSTFSGGNSTTTKTPSSEGTPVPTKQVLDQKRRSIFDLKQKYIAYGNRFTQVRSSNQNEAKRILQAMEIIVKMAGKQGIGEKEFLSNRYVMNYKTVKEIRKNNGY